MAFRDGPFETIKVPLAWTAAVVVVIALVASVLLIVSDRRTDGTADGYGAVRAGFDSGAAPVGGVLSAPVRWTGSIASGIRGYFFAISDNRRMRAELVEMRRWQDDAIALKSLNARYEAMLGVRTDPPVAMATGRAITDARGPFANGKLIDVGTAQGVRIGNPVINEHGLVGRIVGAAGGVSRVLLLTDVASRMPVLIERTDARAVLTGDASPNPRLEFIRDARALQPGDRVLSSGDGGGIPRGVPIGVVAKGVDGTWRIKLFSDRGAIDLVRVMLFQDFGQLVDANALNAPPLAGLGTAPVPDATQTAAIGDAAARRTGAATGIAPRPATVGAARTAPARPSTSPPTPSPDVAGPVAPPAVPPGPAQ